MYELEDRLVKAVAKSLKRILRRGSTRRYLRAQLAYLRRTRLSGVTFVGVTGSAGKSTTVKLIHGVLSRSGPCHSSNGPNVLTHTVDALLTLPRDIHFCVRELSGHAPGTMAAQARLLRPKVAVVTRVGEDHYKAHRGRESAAREKGLLVEGLGADGIAVLNADDPLVSAMGARTRARVIRFGISPEAELRATDVRSNWPRCLEFTVLYDGETVPVRTWLVGAHWATAVLAGIACGLACGISLVTCVSAAAEVEPVFARCSVHRFGKGASLVLDSDKASYWTVEAGLDLVRNATAARKTIVFGTISDYPGGAGRVYRNVARKALECADRVIFVGPHAQRVRSLQREYSSKQLLLLERPLEVESFLYDNVIPGELIYVKSSRVDHLEQIVPSRVE